METVMWDRGLLATPDIIGHTLKAMLVSSNPHSSCVFASARLATVCKLLVFDISTFLWNASWCRLHNGDVE